MIEKIVKNLEKQQIFHDEINYLLSNDSKSINYLYEKSSSINKKYYGKIKLESKLFYPLSYNVESSCPTCGYRTPESHKKYNPEYIESVIKYNIASIKSYGIRSINCYNIANYKNNEKNLFLKILDEEDIDKNIQIDTFDDLDFLKKYEYSGLIVNSSNEDMINQILNDDNIINSHKIIVNMEIYNNRIQKNIEFLNNIKNYKIDGVEIIGYDPFYDDAREYNPLYTREYLKKIISILKIAYPELELKISYATNNNNYFEDTLKLGISTINGIYCEQTDTLFNVDKISKILQKY